MRAGRAVPLAWSQGRDAGFCTTLLLPKKSLPEFLVFLAALFSIRVICAFFLPSLLLFWGLVIHFALESAKIRRRRSHAAHEFLGSDSHYFAMAYTIITGTWETVCTAAHKGFHALRAINRLCAAGAGSSAPNVMAAVFFVERVTHSVRFMVFGP